MKRATQIEKQIKKVKKELMELGALRPGSLSQQYNVCGKATCRCKDPENPRKHGPYYQVSYSRKGKSSSVFVRPEDVAAVKKQLVNYKKLMELVNLWIDLELEQAQITGKAPSKKITRRQAQK